MVHRDSLPVSIDCLPTFFCECTGYHFCDTTSTKNLHTEEDLGDFFRRIRHKTVDTAKTEKKPKVAILPSFGYNPSLGAIIGAKFWR